MLRRQKETHGLRRANGDREGSCKSVHSTPVIGQKTPEEREVLRVGRDRRSGFLLCIGVGLLRLEAGWSGRLWEGPCTTKIACGEVTVSCNPPLLVDKRKPVAWAPESYVGCRSRASNTCLCLLIGSFSHHGNLLARRNIKSTTCAAWPPILVISPRAGRRLLVGEQS